MSKKKKPIPKKGLVEWGQSVGPEFKPQNHTHIQKSISLSKLIYRLDVTCASAMEEYFTIEYCILIHRYTRLNAIILKIHCNSVSL
jgi:hypothetical protein